jgi:hypothetical protein
VGGGIVYIYGSTSLSITGSIINGGVDGLCASQSGCSNSFCGGNSGGGAGGSIILSSSGAVTLGAALANAAGGASPTCSYGRGGGAGGAGRIAVHGGSKSGTTTPTYTSF